MSRIEQLAERWLAWTASASWQIAIVVAVVAILAWAARGASSRLRHALWLLVLVKVFLPPDLTAPWSMGRWAAEPFNRLVTFTSDSSESNLAMEGQLEGPRGENVRIAHAIESGRFSPTLCFAVWVSGCIIFWIAVIWRYSRVARAIADMPTLDEGPLRVALERIGLKLGLRSLPDLRWTRLVTSPFLFGVLRPSIILPEGSLKHLHDAELDAVLAHELVHYQRRDTWIGWLQVIAQGLFWFHPLVWWANRQLRHARECVCDESVLRLGQVTTQCYGESIVRVLTASRGQSLVTGSLVGIFERGVKLYDRLENIMNYKPQVREFGWGWRLAVAVLALALLPMGADFREGIAADSTPPQIVKTTPAVGATDVDPGLKEITVTFDRAMGKGMSWTGGPPEFPPMDESRKAGWRDDKTCVLPVKLQAGTMYRVGINSMSFQNFKSAAGVAAKPSTIQFTTKGATAEVQNQLKAPEIVSLEPKNGATDVDPKTNELKVTFNMPMGEGMSWTGGGPAFPKLADDKKPSWSKDGLTCTLPVKLEAGHDYQLGLNSQSHKNFQNKAGVPLMPVTYKFRTK